ncbi:TPA: hypothetical protein HA265_01845 [Candidatus Woesearchaeota archaeon]|nr:hypothetical protein [Candidatus Woesearchaeota archaeon]
MNDMPQLGTHLIRTLDSHILECHDILHVEDDSMTAEILELSAAGRELSYHNVKSLEGLEEYLDTGKARLYVVDGTFFMTDDDGSPTRNYVNAVLLIRAHGLRHGYAPKIVVFSGDNDLKEAEGLDVRVYKKGRDRPLEIIDEFFPLI